MDAKPEPIRRNGFQYDGTFATIDGVAYERPQHLLRLCFPTDPEKWKIKLGRGRPPKMEKITEHEAARTLTRKFMLAQFRFYGLPPPYQSSSDEVLALFREQVTSGNFRKMADDIETLRDDMAAEWETRKDTSTQRPRGRPKGSTRKVEDAIPATIVGAYVITSKEIQDQWSVNGTLTLDVAPTASPGVYKATFHFGVILGVMVLSADEKQLANHVRRLDAGDDPDNRANGGVGGSGGGNDDVSTPLGSKRKQPPQGAAAGRQQQQQQHQQHHPPHQQQHQQQMVPGKKARTSTSAVPLPQIPGANPNTGGLGPMGLSGMAGLPGMPTLGPGGLSSLDGLGPLMGGPGAGGGNGGGGGGNNGGPGMVDNSPVHVSHGGVPLSPASGGGRPPLKFYVRWRGRGPVENNMQTGEHRGTLKFTNKHYTKFAGEMDLGFLGADEITGKRVSDVPTLSGESWSDYLETVYDWTRGNRWN